jgi:hypothetical protein
MTDIALFCAMTFQIPFPVRAVTNRAPVDAILMPERCLPWGYWTKDPRSGLVHEAVRRIDPQHLMKQVNRLQSQVGQIYLSLHHFIAVHRYSP